MHTHFKGIILKTVRVKEEDLIVKILTNSEVLTLYRFYGARHSYINVGYHIDFEVEESPKTTIKRLRNVSQIPPFLFEPHLVIFYNQFINLLSNHLVDVTKVDDFYYNLVLNILEEIKIREPKRVLIENYVKLLEKEGRLHREFECFLCERKIEGNVVLARAFLPAHENCIYSAGFEKEKLKVLFNEKKSLLLDDSEIDRLYQILNLGL